MQKFEQVIKEHLIATFKSKQSLLEMLNQPKIEAHELYVIYQQSETLAKTIESANHLELEAIYQKLIKRITINGGNIQIEFKPDYLSQTLGLEEVRDGQSFKIRKPTEVRRRGQELKLIIGGKQAEAKRTDMSLIKLMAKAHLLKHEIETGTVSSIKEFAEKYSIDHGDAKNLIPLSYLAPSIIDAIYDGSQPSNLTTSRLKSVANRLPIRWNEQRQVLGFAT
jgi:replication initiation and membrane attachment protein DnaB